jgi:hypothetical protein
MGGPRGEEQAKQPGRGASRRRLGRAPTTPPPARRCRDAAGWARFPLSAGTWISCVTLMHFMQSLAGCNHCMTPLTQCPSHWLCNNASATRIVSRNVFIHTNIVSSSVSSIFDTNFWFERQTSSPWVPMRTCCEYWSGCAVSFARECRTCFVEGYPDNFLRRGTLFEEDIVFKKSWPLRSQLHNLEHRHLFRTKASALWNVGGSDL